jgi:hypothetical protein
MMGSCVNNRLEKMCKEVVAAYLKVPPQHLLEETEDAI